MEESGSYFSLYKIYYDALNGKNLTSQSAILNSSIALNKSSIYSYITELENSNWKEAGKEIITGVFLNNLEEDISKLLNYISINLTGVCKLSDKLFEKICDIKEAEEVLNANRNMYNFYKNQIVNNNLEDGSSIDQDLQTNVNLYARLSNSSLTEIKQLCLTANTLIYNILSYNEGLDVATIRGMLPNYNSIDEDKFEEFDFEPQVLSGYSWFNVSDPKSSFFENGTARTNDDYYNWLVGNVNLPEGWSIHEHNKKTNSDRCLGVASHGDGLVIKVSYPGHNDIPYTGVIYIPFERTNDLTLFCSGSNNLYRFSKEQRQMIDNSSFDSVVFFPFHNVDYAHTQLLHYDINSNEKKFVADGVAELYHFVGDDYLNIIGTSNGGANALEIVGELPESVKLGNVTIINSSSYHKSDDWGNGTFKESREIISERLDSSNLTILVSHKQGSHVGDYNKALKTWMADGSEYLPYCHEVYADHGTDDFFDNRTTFTFEDGTSFSIYDAVDGDF